MSLPCWTDDIDQVMLGLLTKLAKEQAENSFLTSIYHFTNSGVISWYDFAVAIFEEANESIMQQIIVVFISLLQLLLFNYLTVIRNSIQIAYV